jgi:hypothetical protein
LIVEDITKGGTDAEAFWVSFAAKAPPEIMKPRRDSRFANILRALANRLATVPSGKLSC